MNILYSGDGNIADGLILSTLSLAKNVSAPLDIYILTASFEYRGKKYIGLDANLPSFLKAYLKQYNENIKITLIDVSDRFEEEMPSANMNTRFTPCCMLRLFADGVDALPSKILYLDNDVICREDPSFFYDQQLGDCSMAGVLDYYGGWFFRQRWYRRDYLNSGVLLLNLVRIRENGLFKDAREMCVTKKMFMPDQSALNKLCQKKIICDRRYNEQRKLRPDTVFQHFTTSFRFLPYFHSVSVKPWNIEGMHKTLKLHEYDGLLDEYLNIKKIYKGEPKHEH